MVQTSYVPAGPYFCNKNGSAWCLVLVHSDLCAEYALPGISISLYLQLRSSMRAFGVLWGSALPSHPLHKLLALTGSTQGLVSKLYQFISKPQAALPVECIWYRDISAADDKETSWTTVWENLHNVSKNPDHQLIHFKFVHRMYLTPRWCHSMSIISSANCDLCQLNTLGSFMHMYWECPTVTNFWKQVVSSLSDILKLKVPISPNFILLNVDSSLGLSLQKRRILWTALTAPERMLAVKWLPPQG